MEATIKRIAHGKWNVLFGDKVMGTKKTKLEAQELAGILARPGVFIDESDGYGDFSYFDKPDGSSANSYPSKKLPDTPHE